MLSGKSKIIKESGEHDTIINATAFFFHLVGLLLISSILFSHHANTAKAPAIPNEQVPAPIKLGMSTALNGPAAELGKEMKLGVEIYFDRINASGGVQGHRLELIVLDDQYDPKLTGKNMHELIEKDQVLAIIGNVGTPTAIVSIPIAIENKTLFFGAFSGSGILRKTPPDRYVINLRASYEEETSAMIKNLLSIGIKPDEFAFFTQDDSYGDSVYQGAMKALKEAGYSNPETLPHGQFERNTLNVEEGLAKILTSSEQPKAIIMVGTYAPNAKFIKLAANEFHDALFLNVSFVGSDALMHALGTTNAKVIVTQVVPNIDADLPAVHEYQADLSKYGAGAQPDFGSLEGYLDARLLVMGLQQAAKQNKLTREGIIDSLENLHNVDLGIGLNVGFDKDHHQASHTIWPTILKNGKFLPLNWSDLKIQRGKQ